ncbi:MAG: threonine synthase [Deltaproteobacteria bacterium]|nr:threonine synthase [Deltaproteobacteria bacterium]
MTFYSTADRSHRAGLREAVLAGLPPVGGLYMPERIETLPASFFESTPTLDFADIASRMARPLLGPEVPDDVLERIVRGAFDFPVPLLALPDGRFVLELFHGPTLAFKDFAARFMARLMAHFVAGGERTLHILVATSGDTGSAVAHGFLGVPGIMVHVLFPSGRVSAVQEAQLTSAGENVTALEIAGTFDDCQRLVKSAFLDPETRARLMLSSANSINVARLVPQSFYYCFAWSRLPDRSRPVVVSVPSGNFGNLTGGLIAKRMGLPVSRFIAATNANDAVPRFLSGGAYEPRPAVATLSNAMDVSSPSNWERILDLCGGDRNAIGKDLTGCSFDDDATRKAIRELHTRFGYVADPHGAVGWLGLERYGREARREFTGVFLETAHPAKFLGVVETETGVRVEVPDRVRAVLSRPRHAVKMAAEFAALKEYLLAQSE